MGAFANVEARANQVYASVSILFFKLINVLTNSIVYITNNPIARST